MIINQKYIDAAISIRSEAAKLMEYATDQQHLILALKNEIEAAAKELENLPLSSMSVDEIQSDVIARLTNLEKKGGELTLLIEPINERLANLQKQENILYEAIKTSYPELSDDEIVEELKQHITN